MELGYSFMQEIMRYPVEENMEKLIYLPEAVKKKQG